MSQGSRGQRGVLGKGLRGDFWVFFCFFGGVSPPLPALQVLEQLLVALGTPKNGEPRRGALLVALTARGDPKGPPCTLTGGWGVLGGVQAPLKPP